MEKKTKKQLKKEAKSKLNKLDKEWSLNIRKKFGNKCVYCCGDKYLNAHHILPREIREFRHDMDNGIALCPKHHKFNFEFSAHKNPLAFFKFMSENYPKQMSHLMKKYEKYAEKVK